MENLPFFYCFSSFIFFASIELLLAADTTSPEVIIQDGEILSSSAHRFELGFFSPGISKNRYLGIWYKESPETVAWVANRNNPILDSNGVLAISKNGSLILLDERKSIIWSSNMSRKVENPVAELLDTGNFVLMDNFTGNASEYLWQSFDYPSDVLLPGMKLGRNLKTGVESYLTSWRSDDDPYSGDYTSGVDIQFLPQLVIYNGSTKVSRSGTWNGFFFGGIPIKTNLPFKPILVHNQNEYTFRYESLNHSIVMQLKLNKFGVTEWQIWNDSSSGWDVNYSAPEGLCGHYGFCGANSVCDIEKKPICECLKGFVPNSQNNQTSSEACVRGSPLDCEGRDRFIKLEGIKLPDLLDVSVNESMNLKECEAKCLKNCSCTAYINSNLTGGDTGCFMLFGDLIDIRKLVENRGTRHIYLRVPASELVTDSSNKTSTESEDNKSKSRQFWIIVISIMSLAMITLVSTTLHVRRKCRRKGEDLLLFDLGQISEDLELIEVKTLGKNRKKKVKLPLFSFASVSAATDNFSASNKLGEGGFGPVYRGKLRRGEEIAVKRLSKRSRQGWEELKNEAVLIAKLQHKNLVRLLGCCIEQDEKILIYEYMPNKSLDIFLFDPTKRLLLDCGTLVRIIEGIAQGLLYLHEYSRIQIIHRDLKASNILLDKNMNPKISDFGLAKKFHCNESEASTNRISGTPGYMSPEYAFEGVYSNKSDVFSFGVLLLEIISGKKSTGLYQTNGLHLLGHAWDLWTNDRASELIDPLIGDASSEHILLRYVNIALLCVEEGAEDRPTMSDVVLMLMNDSALIPSPKQPAFACLRSTTNSNSFSSESENCILGNVTI